MIQTADFKGAVSLLLDEAFGLSKASSGEFLDTGQGGLVGSIAALDARTASSELHPGEDTIASHCAHLLYDLNLFLAYEQGQAPRPDYPASWRTRNLDQAAWKNLRLELQAACNEVQNRLQSREIWPKIVISAWLALLAHVSYHVGVIHKLRSSLEASS
jgi:hypothetical protein